MTTESGARRVSIGTLCTISLGCLLAWASLVPESLDPLSGDVFTSMIKSIGFILILPGTSVSMAIRGTSNPIPCWPAALINGVLYFGLVQVAVLLIRWAARATGAARG
jgi:hypothetical protein